ncbi:universal stress protein [Neorhizobium alkalisoli]|uniref:universal stress protein n=1 Tax=Neorhizobium alkalisoli TaxID=528178 RepID=UPI000CF9CFF0|nr:universal stress protein [Neorhizobium alkalisoli]
MEIGSFGRDYPTRPAKPDDAPTSKEAAGKASSDPASRKEEFYDPLVHGLTSLTKATEEAEEQAKARAKRKLEDAKQQLEFMRRWGLDPEVIARQAAQLGVIVAGAAREFTEALTGGSGFTSSVPASTPSGAETADPVLDRNQQSSSGGESVQDPRSVSRAEQAYLDEMGETPRDTPGYPRTTSRRRWNSAASRARSRRCWKKPPASCAKKTAPPPFPAPKALTPPSTR